MVPRKGAEHLHIKSLSLLFLMLALGYLGNAYGVTIYPEIRILWGSVFSFITLGLLGLPYALVITLVINWGIPSLLVLSLAEVFIVYYIFRRKVENYLLAGVIFWFLVGIPVNVMALFPYEKIDWSFETIRILTLAINGIANIFVASILCSFYSLRKWFGLESRNTPLHYMTINYLMAFVLVPGMFSMVFMSTFQAEVIEEDILRIVEHEAHQIDGYITFIEGLGVEEQKKTEYIRDAIRYSLHGEILAKITLIDDDGNIIYENNRSDEFSSRSSALCEYSYRVGPERDITMRIIVDDRQHFLLLKKSMFNTAVFVSIFTVVMSLAALALNRKIASPIAQLATITSYLPINISSHRKTDWPDSKLAEISDLIGNFKLMTITLEKNFDNISEHNRFQQNLIDTIPNPLFYKDSQGIYLGCNKAFEQYLGKPKKEIIGKSVYGLSPKDLADKYFAMDQELFDHPGTQVYESRVRYADGSLRDVIFYKATFSGRDNKVAGLIGVILDISERKEAETALAIKQKDLEERLAYFKSLYMIATCIISSNDKQELLNDVVRILGEAIGVDRAKIYRFDRDIMSIKAVCLFEREEIADSFITRDEYSANLFTSCLQNYWDTGMWFESHVDNINPLLVRDKIATMLHEDLNIKSLLWYPFGDDKQGFYTLVFHQLNSVREWTESEIAFIELAAQQVEIALQKSSLIEERNVMLQKMTYQAYHDSLTQLPNRLLFYERFRTALDEACSKANRVGLLFLDLDRFKNINDTLGHAVGDELLLKVAHKLTSRLSEGILLARLGGDEFVVLVPEVSDEEGVKTVSDTIIKVFQEPWYLGGEEYVITTSIGGAIYPDHGQDVETLMRHADIAMYKAKELGRNNYRIYVPEMNQQILMRLELENSLRKTTMGEGFELYYQPQVNASTGELIGCEALIRWKNSEGKIISPSEFIPLAEETRLIIPLGEWIIKEVCYQRKYWDFKGLSKNFRVYINISVVQAFAPGFVSMVERVIQHTGVNPEHIGFEITETLAMEDGERTLEILNELEELGIKVAIDDFGTGYSSLNYLTRYPIKCLKVDRAFIKDITHSASDLAVATSIIHLAKNLKMSVVAEGVETEAQRDLLLKHGCYIMQGYLFSKPLNFQDFEKLLPRTREQLAE